VGGGSQNSERERPRPSVVRKSGLGTQLVNAPQVYRKFEKPGGKSPLEVHSEGPPGSRWFKKDSTPFNPPKSTPTTKGPLLLSIQKRPSLGTPRKDFSATLISKNLSSFVIIGNIVKGGSLAVEKGVRGGPGMEGKKEIGANTDKKKSVSEKGGGSAEL